MISEEQPRGWFDRLRESVTAKLVFIGVLIVVLLIPSSLINNLITERASRQDDITQEVSEQWSGSQLIKGPVLIIPYKKQVRSTDTANHAINREVIENLYVLPDNLHIKAALDNKLLHRGIFDVGVYTTTVQVWGNFTKADLNSLSITPDQLLLNKAAIIFSVSDLKGLKNKPIIKTGTQSLVAEPAFEGPASEGDWLQAHIDLTAIANAEFSFNYSLDLQGSQELSFLHLGKTTDVEASGNWGSPSFDGRYLPDQRNVNDSSFKATWRMLYYNRPFPQQWVNNNTLLSNDKKLGDAVFGVKLRVPVDQYQKTMRTSKYAILIILLTFVSLFLTEVIRKQRIHMFNYILIGAAMVIYYTLLLSFSERIGYNWAYLVASVSTIALITTFIGSLLKNKNAALLFSFILSVIYAFIFVIIQLEDFALMMGSIALFIIVGLLMYFSRKINWDKHS
jgi:inner membrane protein